MADEDGTPQANDENAAAEAGSSGSSADAAISQEELDALTAQAGPGPAAAGDAAAPTAATSDASTQADSSTPPSDGPISQKEPDTPTAPASAAQPATSNAAPSAPDANVVEQAELDALLGQIEQTGKSLEPAVAAPTPAPSVPDAATSDANLEAEMAAAIAAEMAAEQAAQPDTPPAPAEAPAAPAGREEPVLVGSRIDSVTPAGAVPLETPALSQAAAPATLTNIDLLDDVELDVKIELGRTEMYIEDVLRLGEGSVIELDKLAGDPVDIYVNERLIARGEVLVLNDNFCVRINDILSPTAEVEDGK